MLNTSKHQSTAHRDLLKTEGNMEAFEGQEAKLTVDASEVINNCESEAVAASIDVKPAVQATKPGNFCQEGQVPFSVDDGHVTAAEAPCEYSGNILLNQQNNSDVKSGEQGNSLSDHLNDGHVKEIAKLTQLVHALECSNVELKRTLAENCQVIADLKRSCESVERMNKTLELALANAVTANTTTARDLTALSAQVASFAVARQDVDKPADDGTKQELPQTETLQSQFEQRIAELERVSAESSTRFGDLSKSVDCIERDLQRFIRRHSIIVDHLCPKEDRSAQDAFLVFVNCVLKVSADESDIDGLHLIDNESTTGASSGGSGSPAKSAEHFPRPVLVTFTCYRTRMRVYKAWLSYRVGASGDSKAAVGALSGERGQGVCIREYLTAAQEIVYRAAMDALHRRSGVIVDCWTFRGRTFVRTGHGDVREFSEIDQMVTKEDSKYRSCSVM